MFMNTGRALSSSRNTTGPGALHSTGCVHQYASPFDHGVGRETSALRYPQKLFTARGSTCSEFIYSLRLDLAARLLHPRASLETSQPLTEIAYACGFRDYTHFARRFRHRFGYPPGGRAEGETVRAGTGERAPRAHDVRPPAGLRRRRG
jgi:AraC-like DNA-binding protein